MTREEKIAAAREDVIAKARLVAMIHHESIAHALIADRNLQEAIKALDAAEHSDPDRPRLMTPHDRAYQAANRFTGYTAQVVATAAINEDRAEIAAKVRELPRRPAAGMRDDETVMLADVLDLIEGR